MGIQVLQLDEGADLVELILAENFTKDFIGELATEFDLSISNITVDSVEASSVGTSEDDPEYQIWFVGYMIGIFICMLVIMFLIFGAVLRNRAEKEQRHSNADNLHHQQPTKGNRG